MKVNPLNLKYKNTWWPFDLRSSFQVNLCISKEKKASSQALRIKLLFPQKKYFNFSKETFTMLQFETKLKLIEVLTCLKNRISDVQSNNIIKCQPTLKHSNNYCKKSQSVQQ